MHEQDRRVVGEVAAWWATRACPTRRIDSAADRLSATLREQVDEPLDAELLAAGGVLLDHTVGVEEHVVAGLSCSDPTS